MRILWNDYSAKRVILPILQASAKSCAAENVFWNEAVGKIHDNRSYNSDYSGFSDLFHLGCSGGTREQDWILSVEKFNVNIVVAAQGDENVLQKVWEEAFKSCKILRSLRSKGLRRGEGENDDSFQPEWNFYSPVRGSFMPVHRQRSFYPSE